MKKEDRRKIENKLTPMQKQWVKIKNQYPNHIIFWRLGDFYETFNEDAIETSKALNITLTSRKTQNSEWPLAGVPHHSLEGYLSRLVKQGYKVAVVEQLEDPSKAKKIVKRGVVRLVSKGTVTSPESLDKTNNYLVALTKEEDIYGLAAIDISTGEFLVSDFNSISKLDVELTRLLPSEILVEKNLWEREDLDFDASKCVISYKPDYYFDIEQGRKDIIHFFDVVSLDGFGLEKNRSSIGAAGATLRYLKETQFREEFPNITKITPIKTENFMILDSTTIRSLELIRNIRDNTEYGTLRSILDNTKTSIGSRLLNHWLLRPSLNRLIIQNRLNSVEELYDDIIRREELREILGQMSDIERIIGRVALSRAKPRELLSLKGSVELIPKIKKTLKEFTSNLLIEIEEKLDPLKDLVKIIEEGIKGEVPTSISEGGVIRDGYNNDLDELRNVKRNGKSFLSSLEAREKKQTGIKTLKVKFNKVFGYFIEVSKSYTDQVPKEYERKQTLVNAERYIIPELKEYEEKILTAEEKILLLEEELYNRILEKLSKFSEKVQANAHQCAILDILATFAQNAVYNNYTKPEILEEEIYSIKKGRHPVVEELIKGTSFIPNDCEMGKNENRILIITGPNMAGKCVSPGTLVFTDKGILPIKSFKPPHIREGAFKELNITVIGVNSEAKTSHFYSDGMKPTIKIKTRRGYKIEGTYNHPILVRTPNGREKWKKLSEITGNEYIIINRKNGLWGSKTKIDYKIPEYPNQVKKYNVPKILTEELAYMMGLLVGDGTLTYEKSYMLSNKNSFLKEKFIQINEKLFGYTPRIKKNNKDVFVSSKFLREFLAFIGLGYQQAHEKEVPETILKSPKNIIKTFLQGLFDTDGTAGNRYDNVTFSTSSRKLAEQVHIILLNWGIISSLRVKRTNKRPSYNVAISGMDSILFHKKIGFTLPKKKKRRELASALRMTNEDSVPFLENILRTIHKKYLTIKNELPKDYKLKYNKNIRSIFDNYIPQKRNLSFTKIKELIEYCKKCQIECPEIEKIHKNNYFYDEIKDIKKSESEVFDFSVPNGHAFVGNGIINHNSTYLRQIALIVLMTHVGCFVPAENAKIGLTDRIFTRIGAHDVLVEHRSTFMVEMIESANILNNTTDKSLVILDEVGRGTSTFDGVSLAWAITEYLHNNIGRTGPRTLLATHYHELIELEETLPRVKNLHVSVKNVDGDIHFLYKVKEGGIDESYGVHVASLAGIPDKVVDRAEEILSELHYQMAQENDERREEKKSKGPKRVKGKYTQITLLGETALQKAKSDSRRKLSSTRDDERKKTLLKEIADIDVKKITPIEAINIIDQLTRKSKQILKEEK